MKIGISDISITQFIRYLLKVGSQSPSQMDHELDILYAKWVPVLILVPLPLSHQAVDWRNGIAGRSMSIDAVGFGLFARNSSGYLDAVEVNVGASDGPAAVQCNCFFVE